MTRYARIIGTGSYLPPKRVTNDELAAQLAEKGIETSDEWIVTRSGIRARHFAAPDVACSDLAVKAAERAIEAAGIDRSELDLILVATSTPDFVFPSTACLVQQRLGVSNKCPAFDVQAVCSGFVYALAKADKFIRSGAYRNVLVTALVQSCCRPRTSPASCRPPCMPTAAMPTSCACPATWPPVRSRAAPSCTWMVRPSSSWR
jgi:3-oxoacyl-[acyl-carrier-protein] synthase-3